MNEVILLVLIEESENKNENYIKFVIIYEHFLKIKLKNLEYKLIYINYF